MNTRLDIIKKELNHNIQAVYKFKETKKEVIEFYTNNESKLNLVKKETFDNYSFLTELIEKCETKQKQSFSKKILNKIVKLERHRYAPNMNKTHLPNNETIKTPECININQAVAHIIKTLSINQLEKLTSK